jgi:NAD+ diphosphatase
MLGFIADYASGDIQVQEAEIAQADWFHLGQLPKHPPAQTISGFLIRQYQRERGFLLP